jgi:hypothetical protein
MEGDVIAASVRNAFEQGCDEVFLIDNDSPDDTVEQAVGAGATLYASFATDRYDEALKYAMMRHLMAAKSDEAGDDVWWLLFDADEFPRTYSVPTVRSLLDDLDDRVRTVGARYVNHYPTDAPHYRVGEDPIPFQPMAELFAPPTFCAQRHRKHPLLRYRAGEPLVEPGLGFHSVISSLRPVLEPELEIVQHHVPLRREEDSRRRLEELFRSTDGGPRAHDDELTTNHMRARYETLDAVYQGRWHDVQTMGDRGPVVGVTLSPWWELVGLSECP